MLSALILASTASVRSAKAEAPTPDEPKDPSNVVELLKQVCAPEQTDTGCSAAFAARQIRYDEGLISRMDSSGNPPRSVRLKAMFDAAQRVLSHALILDWNGWNESLLDFKPGEYDCYAQNQPAFVALSSQINCALQSASVLCGKVLSRDLRAENLPLLATGQPETKLSWRECAALYYAFGADMTRVLTDAFAVRQEGSVLQGIVLHWPSPSFSEIVSRGTEEQAVEAELALYYLNTVYQDDGSVAPVTVYSFSKEYLATIAHPVPGGTIKNGWYDPRSHRTRLHTGTDIRVSARTPILAVTDGVVRHVGYLPIPGNYVIIRDPFGFEYHYYHMYEISTFVKEGDVVRQGQQIGRVGSTGNSVAYHLHLGLVSPEGVYLNPYDLFTQAGIGPILTK